MALNQFETEPDYMTPLNVMLQTVLPILDSMTNADDNDGDLVGNIKEKWVNFLADPDSLDSKSFRLYSVMTLYSENTNFKKHSLLSHNLTIKSFADRKKND